MKFEEIDNEIEELVENASSPESVGLTVKSIQTKLVAEDSTKSAAPAFFVGGISSAAVGASSAWDWLRGSLAVAILLLVGIKVFLDSRRSNRDRMFRYEALELFDSIYHEKKELEPAADGSNRSD